MPHPAHVVPPLLLLALALGRGAPPRAPPAPGAPREELDFLLGDWLARDPAGRAVATVTISREYGGASTGRGGAAPAPPARRWA